MSLRHLVPYDDQGYNVGMDTSPLRLAAIVMGLVIAAEDLDCHCRASFLKPEINHG